MDNENFNLNTTENNNNPYPPNYYGSTNNPTHAEPTGSEHSDGSYRYNVGGNNQNTYNGYQPNGWGTPPPPKQETPPYQWDFDNMKHSATAYSKPKQKNKGMRTFGVIVACIALVVVVGFAGYGIYVATTGDTLDGAFSSGLLPNQPGVNNPSSVPNVDLNDKPVGGALSPDSGFSNSEIYKKVSPSVVGIISYTNQGYYGGEEQGSGIIMSEDGYIITNAHVVSNGSTIEVVLVDGTSYEAMVIGADSQTDLAVLKVEATGLPAAEFGNSEQLEVGERVVAIGNPGGLQFASTLTVGYVSALNRTLSTGDAGYALDCIQTDAAINPGNSGGALVNAYGQVIGINSAKISATDYEGMGFAIPINDAMPIIDDIIKNGKVTGRAMLGITAAEMSATYAQLYGVPMGLIINDFSEGADIQRKGAQQGDIITHINGKPIYNITSCAEALKNQRPGDTVQVSIFRMDRRGKSQTFNLDIVLMGS